MDDMPWFEKAAIWFAVGFAAIYGLMHLAMWIVTKIQDRHW